MTRLVWGISVIDEGGVLFEADDVMNALYSILKTVLQLVTEIPPFTISYVWVGPASTKSFPSVCSPRVPKDKGQKADRNPSEFTPCCPPQVSTKILSYI